MEPAPPPPPKTMTPEERAEVVEQGGPWITLTFTSDDQMFVQQRVMSLVQAEALVNDLTAEIASAKNEYNITGESDG